MMSDRPAAAPPVTPASGPPATPTAAPPGTQASAPPDSLPTAGPPGDRPPVPPLVAGVVVDVAPDVRRLVAPNPGPMTGPGTNTYLVGAGTDLVVVDPGPDDDAHLSALLAACDGRVASIVVTHTHIDHSPLAARLKAETGAEVLAGGRAPSRQPPGLEAHDLLFVPDRRLADGEAVIAGRRELRVVRTPGHAAHHLCFDLDGLLFSGDHVMSGSTVVICPPDGDMGDYMASLRRVRRRAPNRIAPGHGAMIDDPAAVLDHYLAHRRSREEEVLAGLAAAGPDGTTPEALVAVIYRAVARELHPVARYSVWAHLRQLAAEGRAVGADTATVDGRWWSPSLAPPSLIPPAPLRPPPLHH
jgi:glyoxylase-like metal-dependent hydrolase (beta-lactamase superfamily II)